MRNEESEFSSLRTVRSFDRGEDYTVAIDETSQRISPSSLLVASLAEQLCRYLETDPGTQRELYMTICRKLRDMNIIGDGYEREELQHIRHFYQKSFYKLLKTARSTLPENKILCTNVKYLSHSNIIDLSRYSTDFYELEHIAEGGFGVVYKAQHKLDKEMYAIKKILIRCSINEFSKTLKEVQVLAKLNHPNVISYKAAWLESSYQQKERNGVVQELPAILDQCKDEDDDSYSIRFEGSEQNGDDRTESSYTTSNTRPIHVERFRQTETFRFSECEDFNQKAVLYIQMKLCKKTLRLWLDERNQENITCDTIDVNLCMEVFKGIAQGVEYIHSKGIVHHDIKPNNIFVNEDLSEVQVGDFGLACYLIAHPSSSLSLSNKHPEGEIGTTLYAAPEQLDRKCNQKSDVYSLGIVLFELIQPFYTKMERVELIKQLRSNDIPSNLCSSHPSLVQIIRNTIKPIEERPTSSALLQNVKQLENIKELQKLKELQNITELQNVDTIKLVAEQNELIKKLQRESQAKDDEIAHLKKQLLELRDKKNIITDYF